MVDSSYRCRKLAISNIIKLLDVLCPPSSQLPWVWVRGLWLEDQCRQHGIVAVGIAAKIFLLYARDAPGDSSSAG